MELQNYFDDGMEALRDLRESSEFSRKIALIAEDEWRWEIALYAVEYEHYRDDRQNYTYTYNNAYDFVHASILVYLRMRPYDHTPRAREELRARRWERLGYTEKDVISTEAGLLTRHTPAGTTTCPTGTTS